MSDFVLPWPTLPLRSLAAEMSLGKMLDKEKNRGTLQPYLRNVNVRWFSFDLSDLKEMRFEDGEGTRFQLRPGDLVICEGGEPGRAAVWRGQAENAKIQKALHRIRFRLDEYDPSFAMYYVYFGTITNRFASYYTGTTIKHLTGAALRQVLFPVPPLNEQRRIVAKIDELFSDLDAGVVALKRAKANLKRYRAAVLKAAVEGKLTEAWRANHPNTEPAQKLLARILTERRQKWEADQLAKFAAAKKEPPKNWREKYVGPKPLVTTGLPELPEGWCWASVDMLCGYVTSGSRGWAEHYTEEGPVFLRIGNLDHGSIQLDLTDFQRVTPPLGAESLRTRTRVGDILISVTADVGMVAVIPTGFEEAYINQHIALCRPESGFHRELAAWCLASDWGQRQFKAMQRGATKVGLGLDDVKAAIIPFPSLIEQTRIGIAVAEKLSQIDAAETAIDHGLLRAARLRQSILKQAFAGKLVPQDPRDEPASVLLEKQRASQNGTPSLPFGSRREEAKTKRKGTKGTQRHRMTYKGTE